MSQSPLRARPSQRHAVWRALVARQAPAVRRGMCAEFLRGMERAALDPTRMPSHRALSRRLHDVCGWRIETVPGLIPPADFFALLRDRRFPSPDWIRSPEHLEYTPEPDAFHDLFGHVPQLASPSCTAILERMAEAAHGASTQTLVELERIYWFTIEFGLVRQSGSLRALGAGLASSIAELQRALRARTVARRPFTLRLARTTPIVTDEPQRLYLVGSSAGALPALLSGLRGDRRRAG